MDHLKFWFIYYTARKGAPERGLIVARQSMTEEQVKARALQELTGVRELHAIEPVSAVFLNGVRVDHDFTESLQKP